MPSPTAKLQMEIESFLKVRVVSKASDFMGFFRWFGRHWLIFPRGNPHKSTIFGDTSYTSPGEEGSELFFIESGTVSVRVGDEEREITTLSQGLGKPWFSSYLIVCFSAISVYQYIYLSIYLSISIQYINIQMGKMFCSQSWTSLCRCLFFGYEIPSGKLT